LQENLHHAAIHALRPFNAALRRVKEFGIEKRSSDRPHAMLWLFKTYALSAGMYASQIWSTQFLKHDNGFSNPLQVAHMAFLKRIFGIKSTSANWCASRMRTGTLVILLVRVSYQILEQDG